MQISTFYEGWYYMTKSHLRVYTPISMTQTQGSVVLELNNLALFKFLRLSPCRTNGQTQDVRETDAWSWLVNPFLSCHLPNKHING